MAHKSGAASSVASRDSAFQAANAAQRKKALSTVVLDVRQVTLLADYFVFTGGESKAQVKAIAQEVTDSLAKLGRKAKTMEGLSDARWVLLDYGDVIIHILQDRERTYYKLEQFWNNALVVNEEEWSDDNLDELNRKNLGKRGK